jgi:hypothetical protein
VRRLADAERIRTFLRRLGARATEDATAYLAGGATAVLLGWRDTTIDVDITFVPDRDDLLRAVAELKNELQTNVELASPAHFIPLPDGWESRSMFVTREGKLSVYHLDPYSQALSKVERGHEQDLADVAAMLDRGLVEPARALALYDQIEPELYRFPAVDPASFRSAVEETFRARS